MASVDSIAIESKFRGCLVGGLLGDCLGAPYEGHYAISKPGLQNYFDKLEGPYVLCMYMCNMHIFSVIFRLFIKVT
jgi:poly(ADP-ribose) glycohydrolase ARH3